ncbi:MAG: hypothetical protein IPI69_15715 [Bacteroidales bacterium]|nr:hypothetical protein [Bacteroidales bacterium]
MSRKNSRKKAKSHSGKRNLNTAAEREKRIYLTGTVDMTRDGLWIHHFQTR